MSYTLAEVNKANHTDIFAASEINKHAHHKIVLEAGGPGSGHHKGMQESKISEVVSKYKGGVVKASALDKSSGSVHKKSEKNDHKVQTHTAVTTSMSSFPDKNGRVETDQVKTTSGQVHQKGVTPMKSGQLFNKNNMLTTSEFAGKNGKTPGNGGEIIASLSKRLAIACGGPGSGPHSFRRPAGDDNNPTPRCSVCGKSMQYKMHKGLPVDNSWALAHNKKYGLPTKFAKDK